MAVTNETLTAGVNEQLRLLIDPTDTSQFVYTRLRVGNDHGTVTGDTTAGTGVTFNELQWTVDNAIGIGVADDEDATSLLGGVYNIYLAVEVEHVPRLLVIPGGSTDVVVPNVVSYHAGADNAVANAMRQALAPGNPVLLVVASSTSLTQDTRIAEGVESGYITHLYDSKRPKPMELVYQILSRVDSDVQAYPVALPQGRIDDQTATFIIYRTTGTSVRQGGQKLSRATVEVVILTQRFSDGLDLESKCLELLLRSDRIVLASGPADDHAEELNRFARHFEIAVEV